MMSDTLDTVLRRMIEEAVRQAGTALMREWQTLQRATTEPKASSNRMLLTSREAATQLAVSERHLHQMKRDGKIPCVRVGKAVRYHVESLRQWILASEGTKQTPAPTASLSYKHDSSEQGSPTKPSIAGPIPSNHSQRTRPNNRAAASMRRPRKEIQTASARRQPEKEVNKQVNPFSKLLCEMGVDTNAFPPVTNGDLRRAAEVDVPTFHGWMYLGRALPEDALGKIQRFVQCLATGKSREQEEKVSGTFD